MLHPTGWPKSIWSIILTLLLLYTATVMPYKIAFIEVTEDSPWFIVDIVMDSLFFTDFLVNLISAYYDNESVLIVNRKKIFCTYLKSWMLLDLIACIPFNFIDTGEDQDGGSS
jgi:hypothetical protein